MQLKYVKTLQTTQNGAAKVCAVSWAPNNQKLAVCTSDRVIILYDDAGERRDKFSTKPADSRFGKKSYTVRGIAFSPDSSKIAVGQSDNIIFVYKIGDEWGDKKTICNKFMQQHAVTCLIWPPEQNIIFGTADGRVRVANVKTNKSSTLYNSESHVVSLTTNVNSTGIISGHADGSIVRFFMNKEQANESQGKIIMHTSPPFALAWTTNCIVAAGCDKRVIAYGSKDGRSVQQFDFARDADEHEFSCATTSPSGQSVVIGSYDRLRIFNWSPRKGIFDEGITKRISNVYTIACIGWKRDGSRLAIGTLCGSVEMLDCCLRRSIYKNKFEMTYVGLSQVIIKNLGSGARVILKSFYNYEIDEVKIMGNDRYLVAHTSDTLMVGDLQTTRLSEVPWRGSAGNEKYVFDHENVCMIFNGGELSLVEYSHNEILASVRTEFRSPHLLSVRLNERKQQSVDTNKKMAYLIDLKTIAIVDLVTGMNLANINHDTKIDWIELNETGQKLLFRDKRMKLYYFEVATSGQRGRRTLLTYCAYVQWVPSSDVVVAQNHGNLCVWYNIDTPDRLTMFPIKGDIIDVEKHNGKTEVIVNEGVSNVSYLLDEGLIEFGTAVDDGDFNRAVIFLESLEESEETEAMWKTLSTLSLCPDFLHIAERCYSSLGDMPTAKFLKETNDIAEETGDNHNYRVLARIAQLQCRFKDAETLYLERNDIDLAIEMYRSMHKWDEAIAISEAKGHQNTDQLKRQHYDWLMSSNQEGRAAELKEYEGDLMASISLYMRAGMAAKAARLICNHQELINSHDTVHRVANALIQGDMHERAGELYEKIGNQKEALSCYRQGDAHQRAVELARYAFPGEVVRLEEQWGDYLITQKQLDAAINHFIEAGATLKAAEAAMTSRQWKKAVQILKVINGHEHLVNKCYKNIADHYKDTKEYKEAEKYYIIGGLSSTAVDMYNSIGQWENAYKIASSYMKEDEVYGFYVKQAENLQSQMKFKEAEKLFVTVNEPDMAISMYKKQKLYSDMIRLVKRHHKELLSETLVHLAKEMEVEGNHTQAELYYVEASEWKTAVNMYRMHNNWEESYRVAKTHGGQTASKQVAYLWAKTLGGESAVKLLTKYGLLESSIDYAAENFAFDFAFELSKVSMQNKQPELYLKYAMYLEDEGKFPEAEAQFIKANKAKEAVLMYVHNQDWDSAQRVAENHDPSSVCDVLVGQARFAFEAGDFQRAEAYLLRAQRPELVIKYYKDANMWKDALRICKDYMPTKLQQLQDEYERTMLKDATKGAENLLAQAREWENSQEYQRAIECYTKMDASITKDKSLMVKCWIKAAELSLKFLEIRKSIQVIELVGTRLVEAGHYSQAAEFYLQVDLVREAIDSFIAGEEWSRAKKIAQQLEPRFEQYIDEKYKEHHKKAGKAEEVTKVDIIAGLDMYVEKGEWQQCLNVAEKQNPQILHKYVAIYAAYCIKGNNTPKALDLYEQYGAPPLTQNFNIYKRIFLNTLKEAPIDDYSTWSKVRNMFLSLYLELMGSQSKVAGDFERLLVISHYCATRAACLSQSTLATVAAKLSVSLLRHTDVIPADAAFYNAGIQCKKVGWENMAFVFLNRFLDLCEAIEENSLDMLDNTEFEETDIPVEIPLPEVSTISENNHEEAKEWVLAISMSQQVAQSLPNDDRDVYEASLISPHNDATCKPCIITGYPVLANKFDLKKHDLSANKEDWNKLLMATKVSRSAQCEDVLKFIEKWSGSAAQSNYSFK